MTDRDFARLAARLSALEKANRRWRMGSLLLFVILVAAVLLAGPLSFAGRSVKKSAPKTVTADQFVLTDLQGRVRGRMTVIKGNPVLDFYDEAGQLWWSAPVKVHTLPVAR